MVVTLTGGERGDILNPAMDLPEVHGRMAEIRRDEMAKAAEILGVEHHWLGFVDSGLPEGDPLPPLPDGCFARGAAGGAHRGAGARDPQVQAARDDHVRRERRLPASGPHPMPPGVGRGLRGRGRLPAFPRRGRAVERAQAVLQPRIPAEAHAAATGRVRQARPGGAVREVAQALGSRARRVRESGDDPHRVREVLRPARRRLARPRHPDRPQRRLLPRAHRMAATALADRGIRAGPFAGSGVTARDRPVRGDRRP